LVQSHPEGGYPDRIVIATELFPRDSVPHLSVRLGAA
jgi:hypothetical protein